MTRVTILDEIFVHLDLETQLAVTALELAGLRLGLHFRYGNAVETQRQMLAACDAGDLYEWMADGCGIFPEVRG